MKALTNILTHLLTMLMILLTACSEEVAEVDNLSQPGQHIRVNLCVPDLKITSRADADGDIRQVTALAFSSANQLLKVETINTITKTNNNGGYNGSFDLTVPNGTQTIHFLANLPDEIKNQLPQSSGTQEEVLRGLISTDFNNLRYWGKASTYDGNTIPIETILYRNMAQIAIAPCPTDTEFNQFPQDSLFIAGLDNPNTSGTLVPYNNGFNFDLIENDYHTLPEGVEKRDKTPEEATPEDGYGPFIYVFEHDNPNDWDEGLFVICGIGRAFYKVALVDNNGNPYDIIRNHKYIIYVSDVDDYQSDDYRAMNYDDAFNKKPINLDVQQEEITPVNLSIKAETNNLTYSSTSTEVVTITVTVPAGVQQLTLDTPGFSIASGETLIKKVSDNTYNINDATKTQDVHFHLKLNNDNATNANIQVNGSGEKVTVTGASTQINIYQRNNEVNGEIVWWQGAMLLDAADDATKIPFPYSYFTNSSEANYLPVGSTIRFNYTDVQNPWIQAANPTTWGQISEFRYDTNQIFLDITQAALDSITQHHNTTWNIDAAFVVQGGGRVLNQITLIPAARNITANATTSTDLYYDSNQTQTVRVQVNIPAGVSAMNIQADDYQNIQKQSGDGNLNGNTYTPNNTNGQTAEFVFTLKQNVTQQERTSTITFSDASNNVPDNEKATSAYVTINLRQEQTTFAVTPETASIDLDSNGDKSVILTLKKPANVTQIQVNHAGKFNITVLDISGYDSYDDGNNYWLNNLSNNALDLRFQLTPKDGVGAGEYTVTFYDQSNNQNNTSATITLTNSGAGQNPGNETYTWTNANGVTIDYNNSMTLEEITGNANISNYYVNNNTIKVYFRVIRDNEEAKFKFITGNHGELSKEYYSLLLTTDMVNVINDKNNGNGIRLLCTNATITQISITPTPTN